MPALQQETPTLDDAFQRAIRHHKAGDVPKAEQLYRQLLAAGQETANTNHNLGILLLQQREFNAAIPLLKIALDRNPAEAQFWLSYADALMQSGRLEEARQALARAESHVVRTDKTEALTARLDAITHRGAQPGTNWMPDLRGDVYLNVLDRMHRILQPKTYFEIGVQTGATLALARCASIGVDPQFQFEDIATVARIVAKPSLSLYQTPSDDFFARFNPTNLFGAPIDFAFLDGMHRCEYLLRDFINTERHCLPNSVIVLHDCLPIELPMAERNPNNNAIDPCRQKMWTGDVWRTALLLKRRRPDLRMLVLDSAPTGLVLISNLNPQNQLLPNHFADEYDALAAEMMSWSLAEITLAGYYEEIGVEPEILFRTNEQILTRLHGEPRAASRPSLLAAPHSPDRTKKERPRGKRAAARLLTAIESPSVQAAQPSQQETAAIMALYQQRQYSEAELLTRALLARFPNHGFALKALGVMLQKQSRFQEALEVKQLSAELLAADAEAQNNLGNALLKLDRFDEAATFYRKALALRPDHAEAESGLGITLHKLGHLDEAEARCRRALILQSDFADASSNLGIVLQDAGRLAEAEASYRRAIAIDPSHADAWNNLGITLQKSNRLSEAEAAHRKAIEINPAYADALTNLAGCLLQQARHADAEACYRRAIELNPGQLNAYTNLLFCLSHNPSTTPEALFAEHLRVGEHFEAPHRASRLPHTNSRDPERTIKVGIVSADLRVHATSHFIEPALTQLARQPSIELHAYANHLIDDEVTARFRAQIPHWNRVVGLSDDALAAKIRADGIDILVDLSGHTAGHRLTTFARKPAPLQCGWIGYLGTSGMQCMDYYLADPRYLPPGDLDRFFTEKLLHIPTIAPFQPNEKAPPVNSLPALANGYVTFASFSRMGKLNLDVVSLWSRLLHAVPGSKLLLGAMASEREFAAPTAWFAANGIPASHLQFHLGARMDDYLKLHHQVDICLDPFPFTGATTTGHALWMGVPTLTLAGRTAPGRLGAAMLHHGGLNSFVANGPEDFVAKGLHWAQNLEALADLRTTLRERFQTSPLGQPEAFAQNLDQAFREIWRKWCADREP
jgi:protein O-GlcNAc transferase